MKNILIFHMPRKMTTLVLFFGLVMLGSCSLKEDIFDTPALSNYIQTEADFASMVNGTYGLLQSGNLEKFEFFKLKALAADDICNPSANFGDISNKSYSADVATFHAVYYRFFEIINNCNAALEILPEHAFTEEFKQNAEGEIKFLRAYCYFNLVRVFGGVPVTTESTTSETEFFKPRNSVDEVYALIKQDLADADALLFKKSAVPNLGLGRTNKGAAQGLLALVNLTYGNYLEQNGQSPTEAYTAAKKYADSVITSNEYSLISNYADLWDVSKEAQAYNEVIFSVPFTRDAQQTSLQSRGSEFAFRYMPQRFAGTAGNTANKTGSGHMRVQPYFYDKYTQGEYANDYRVEVSFLTSYTNLQNGRTVVTYPLIATGNQMVENQQTCLGYINKYRDGDALDSRNHENDLFVMRLSEIYLIKAEAENELNGPTPEAYIAFNKVRERARMANGTPRTAPANLAPGLTKDEFRMKIFDERGLELVAEGHRWFDLVRMKSPAGTTMYEYIFGTYLPSVTPGLPVWNAASKTWRGGRTLPADVVPYNSRLLLFPIPSSQTELTPLIKQNPGY